MFKQQLRTVNLKSEQQCGLINITQKIQDYVRDSGTVSGFCILQVPHATAALVINEDEPGVVDDIMKRILALAPEADYKHDRIDNNARAHIIASIVGSSKILLIKDSQLSMGTWQEIFFVELDGPRSARTVELGIFGE